MTLNRFNQDLTIHLKSSLSKQLLIVLPHLAIATLLIVYMALKDLNIVYLSLSLFCISVSFIYFTKLHLALSLDNSIQTINKNINGDWSLNFENRTTENALIAASTFSSNYLIILNFECISRKKYTVIITPDSVDKNVYRRLKVLIKTKK